MRVIINGEQRKSASSHVDALLGELEYEGTHFAIALNYDVLPRSRWAQTALKNGDEIEIITPRQGGRWDEGARNSFHLVAAYVGTHNHGRSWLRKLSSNVPERDGTVY